MDIDTNRDSNTGPSSSNRLYKSAISGILLNKFKYESSNHSSLNVNRYQGKRLGLISRLIGKQYPPLSRNGNDSASDRWKHDKYESLVSYKPGSIIFVRNLPNDISPEYLKLYFNSAGTVCSIKINKGALTSATVGFVESESAQKAVDSFHKQELNGRTIKVSISDTGKNKAAIASKSNKSTSATGRVSIFDRMG